MTSYLNAMGAALAVRDACKRQVEKGRPIDHLNIDVIVNQAVDGVAGRHHCADDVFDGIAKAIQVESRCTATEAFELALGIVDTERSFGYSPWRHDGWYVHGVRYPGGACGCVSRNYPDKRWRIVCDGRRQALNEPGDVTFASREDAARAEHALALAAWEAAVRAAA